MSTLTVTESLIRKVPYRFKVLKNYSYEPLINFMLQKKYEKYHTQIEQLKNKHKGERCFLIGTGPSLNKTDFSKIQDEILFGVNRLYEGFNRFKISCKYMGIGDEQLFDDIYKKFLSVDADLFITGYAGRHFFDDEKRYQRFIKNKAIVIKEQGKIVDGYDTNIVNGIYSGATIIVDCLQIAMYMGFDEVYLLGCDCDYSGVHQFHGGKNKHVERDEKVNAYVSSMEPVYQMFAAYEKIKKTFEKNNQKVYNATVGGKLEVFERRSLAEI